MNKRFLMIAGVVAVVVGLGVFLYMSRQNTAGTAADQSQQAAQEFIAERGGGENTAVVGRIEKVDGNVITLKGYEGSTSMQVSSGTKIGMEMVVQPLAIQVGDAIMVTGPEDGEVTQAYMVQIGGDRALAELGMSGGSGSSVAAPPPGAAQGGEQVNAAGAPGPSDTQGQGQSDVASAPAPNTGSAAALKTVSGTVEQINGDTIVVKQADGSSATVRMTVTVDVHKIIPAQLTDLQPGRIITAAGTRKGEAFEATTVLIQHL